MDYFVYYDIQQAVYPGWWFSAGGLFLICAGTLFFLSRNNQDSNSLVKSSEFDKKVWQSIGALVIGVLWVSFGWLNYSKFAELRNVVHDGKYEVVEGQVEEFVPMPYEGHAEEHFVVGKHYFSYSDYDLTKAFNQTSSHGGPIHEGLQVRIAYVDDKIVRLEIAK